jgi:ABC transporter DrrB family efflux protein
MSLATVSVPREAEPRRTRLNFSDRLADIWALTRRNLIHISREPTQLSDVTIQPILFTLLFIFVFGSDIPIPGGTYKEYALAGLLTMNLTTSVMGTAVGLSTDLHEGVIDRFRTLPMWRSAVLVGRSIADVMSATLCVTIVGLTGLAIGWRADASPLSVLAGFAIALLFSYCLSWTAACVGLKSKGPESAASFGFIALFPLAFISNALVPTQNMPGWLQAVANWNPVSAVTSACRTLFGNPNPSRFQQAWPMQHPVWGALIWCAVILAVSAPLAAYIFKSRTTE